MAEDLLTGVSTAARNAIFTRVGDLVITLWDFSLGAFVNLILLRKNAEKLEEEMSRLQQLRGDLSGIAEQEAQQPMMEVTDQVSGWINRVDELRERLDRFQDSFERRAICITGFCLGYDAVELQRKVEKLMAEGDAFPRSGLVRQRGPNAFEEVALEMSSSSLVGTETTIQQLRAYIMDDSVGVIGICGMGGAGKTTLLKVINNKFLREEEARDMFNLSIWVTVSQTVDILGIQNSIGDRLGLTLSGSRLQQAKMLFGELSKKRFILFLDDIWEKIDLMEIGIPCPDESNKLKILFTTRSESVCREMDADQIVKVGSLDSEDSWTLFKSKMGKTRAAAVDNPDVRELAKKVVIKCGGLPISLITVGRAMAYATTIEEWRNALNALDQCAEEVSGMDRVLASLKFSFDMLTNTSEGVHLQSCLLYCAFYPEDWNIPKEGIIDYWISEGFLDPKRSRDTHIDHTRDRGRVWIRRLQSACLLEDGNNDETIRLHDTIRDMLVWIGREEYVMLAGDHIARVPHREIWERAKGISLMCNRTIQASSSSFGELRCEALTTLLLRFSLFGQTIQAGFFRCTRSLQVLDLSRTEIEALPPDITTLVELRYLNLEDTKIASLPEELGKLSNLRFLNLNYTFQLRKIPREAVSRLTSLQVLKTRGNKHIFSPHSELGLSDLENLDLLCELSATVKACSSFLRDIAVSHTFSRCIRALEVELFHENQEIGDRIVSAVISLWELRTLSLQDHAEHPLNMKLSFRPGQLPNLADLRLIDLKEAEIVISPVSHDQPLFQRLRYLFIAGCHRLRDLTWVGQLPLLEVIEISRCEKITELLLDDGDLPNDGRTIFTRLNYMSLTSLPSLRSISNHILYFPSLERLSVCDCPNLRRLPFGLGSAEKIRQIRGEQEWWDELEWDQPSVKSYFLDRFAISRIFHWKKLKAALKCN